MRLHASHAAERFFIYAAALHAVLFTSSGLLKIANPLPVSNTIRTLIHRLLGDSPPAYVVNTLVTLLILWELGLGTLFAMRLTRTLALYALLGTDLLFIAVSHLLQRMQLLASCGCFGAASAGLHPLHFALLYSGALCFTLALLSRKRRRDDEF